MPLNKREYYYLMAGFPPQLTGLLHAPEALMGELRGSKLRRSYPWTHHGEHSTSARHLDPTLLRVTYSTWTKKKKETRMRKYSPNFL